MLPHRPPPRPAIRSPALRSADCAVLTWRSRSNAKIARGDRLLQSDDHATEIERGFEAKLDSVKFEDDAFPVLQPGDLCTADNRYTRRRRRVRPGDVRRRPQM